MEFLADGLLIVGSLTIAVYCFVLSRRLNALRDMDSGVGKAIADLSDQVARTRASLGETREQTEAIVTELNGLTARAEIAAGRLELLLATVHKQEDAAPEPRRTSAPPSPEGDARRDVLKELRKIAGKSAG